MRLDNYQELFVAFVKIYPRRILQFWFAGSGEKFRRIPR